MPEERSEEEEAKEELRKIIERCRTVIESLSGNSGWAIVLEDMNKERQRLDDNWQFVTEEDKWAEWRITKIAVSKILNLLSDYANDMQVASKQVDDLEHPEDVIIKDVDTE